MAWAFRSMTVLSDLGRCLPAGSGLSAAEDASSAPGLATVKEGTLDAQLQGQGQQQEAARSTGQEAARSTGQEAARSTEQEAARSTEQEAARSTEQEAAQSTEQEAAQSTEQEAAARSTEPPVLPLPNVDGPVRDLDQPVSQQSNQGQQQLVKLTKDRQGRWILPPDSHLANNLSWVVGFMELANAGDFAANVWNDIPVPAYAIVFMAVGGSVAGIMSIFAFRDSRRACNNVRYLRRQRRLLLQEKRERELRQAATLDVDVILSINFRELGTELVSRWIMDLLMGFGALLICTGTYLAIAGANPTIYLVSNLLSGYIGNTPIALFGLCNFTWAVFIFCMAQSHVRGSQKLLGPCTAVALITRRARKVQVFSVINGTAAILGGVASMITATRWWGYVVLIPVVISSIFCNIWWRKMIGYSRSEGHPPIECHELVHALELAAATEFSSTNDAEAVRQWCPKLPDSLPEMLSLLSRHSMFDQFCLAVVANPDLYQALAGGNNADATDLALACNDMCALAPIWQSMLMDIAKTVVRSVRRDHFRNRERYLAELLGTYCAMAHQAHVGKEGDDAGHCRADVAEKT